MMIRKFFSIAPLVAATALAAPSFAQVDYSVRVAETVISSTFISDPANNFPANTQRFHLALDQSTGTLWVVANQSVSPFNNALIRVDVSGLNIGTPQIVTPSISGSRFDGRAFDFGNGILVQADRTTSGNIRPVNTTTGQLEPVIATAPSNSILDLKFVSGTTWMALEGDFNNGGGRLNFFDQTTGTVTQATAAGPTPVAFAGAQGGGLDSTGAAIVLRSNANAAEVNRVENFTTPGAAIVTNVTPAPVGALTDATWRNLLVTADDHWVLSGRGAGTNPGFVVYIWDGTNVITLNQATLQSLFGHAFIEAPDNNGIAVYKPNATQLRLILGGRDVVGANQVGSILFGNPPSSVTDWYLQ